MLLSLTALPVLLIGGYSYHDARKIIETRVTAQLVSLADLKKQQIMTWIEGRASDARLLADNVLNEEHFSEVLNSRIKAERRAEFGAFLIDNLRGVQRARTGYRELAFVDTRGRRVLSTEPTHIGISLAADPVFSGTFASPTGAFIRDMYLGDDRQPEMAFGHVLHDLDPATKKRRPQLTGAVIIWVRMADELYPLVRAWPGISSTGESLLLRTDGLETLFLSPMRFGDQAPLTFRLPTGSPHRQIEVISPGRDGVTRELDYRGVPILAAYRVIPQTNWELVTKLDVAEAFAPVLDLSRQWVLITVLVLLAAVGMAVLLASAFTRPLAQLAAATHAVAAGDFEVDVPVRRDDELGDLAESFRTMIAAVRTRDTELRAHAERMTRLLDLSNRAEAERRREKE